MIGAETIGGDRRPLGLKPLGLKDPQDPRRTYWTAPAPRPATPPPVLPFEAIYGGSGTLDFKGHPVRYLQVYGSPWFALSDLQEAAGFDPEALEVVNRSDFPRFAKCIATEAFDPEVPGEPGDVTMLSPVGVWYWSHLYDPGSGQAIAAWAKREAEAMHPTPVLFDPHRFLRVLEVNGKPELPPYPLKHSGRKSEWCALREGYEWICRDFPRQREREGIPPPIAAE